MLPRLLAAPRREGPLMHAPENLGIRLAVRCGHQLAVGGHCPVDTVHVFGGEQRRGAYLAFSLAQGRLDPGPDPESRRVIVVPRIGLKRIRLFRYA